MQSLAQSADPSPRRVLIVDDEESLRHTFEVFLSGAGYGVRTSGSPDEALALARKEHFDAVITDIVMPGGDGLTLLRAIHDMDVERPVILMTGNPSLTSATEAVRGGAFDYLAKPVKKDQLLQVVRRAVDRFTLIEEKRRLQELSDRQAKMLAENVQKLESLSVARERLSALLVHDFKNPLAAIISNLSCLRARPEIEAVPDLLECVADADEASQGLLRMITILLDISRMEEAQMTLHKVELPLCEVIEGTLWQFRAAGSHRGIRLQCEIPAELHVHVDRMLLERAVGNLISNGLRYAPRGGFIRITAAAVEGNRVAIFVENNGPPIPAEMRDRVFEKYGQVEGPENRSPLTRGLGLYFCRLAADAHGGAISIEDRPGGGVRFRFELPVD